MAGGPYALIHGPMASADASQGRWTGGGIAGRLMHAETGLSIANIFKLTRYPFAERLPVAARGRTAPRQRPPVLPELSFLVRDARMRFGVPRMAAPVTLPVPFR
jgi:hypothetical protein